MSPLNNIIFFPQQAYSNVDFNYMMKMCSAGLNATDKEEVQYDSLKH